MDIAEQILIFLQDGLGSGGRKVGVDTPLLTGLVDSMQVAELASFVEEEFQVTLEFNDVTEENFRTVRALADLVTGKLAPR
jgi:acyl carrier protein